MIKNHHQPDCKKCPIRNDSLFCNLTDEEMDVLNNRKYHNIIEKDMVIFGEDTPAHAVFCVISGKVKLSKNGIHGKEQIVRLAKEGDLLGFRSILSGTNYYCTATTIDESSVCTIPKEAFHSLIAKNFNLTKALLNLVSSNLREADNKMTELSQNSVKEKVAAALLHIKLHYGFENDGKTINAPVSRSIVAGISGANETTTSRIMSDLRDENVIEFSGKKTKIIDLHKLLHIANIDH